MATFEDPNFFVLELNAISLTESNDSSCRLTNEISIEDKLDVLWVQYATLFNHISLFF